jgi:hypothetical protein
MKHKIWNGKSSGQRMRIMKGRQYHYPNSIEVGDKVIIGEQTSLDLETRYLLFYIMSGLSGKMQLSEQVLLLQKKFLIMPSW